jgi:DNA-directed RNA polymerase subunit M/transcription elongation factor TFIIS
MTASPPPASPSKFVRCPGCGERLGVRPEDAGRKARCTKCGRVFQIGAPAPAATEAKETPPPAPLLDEPEVPPLVSFECSLCQTRMTARSADAGRKLECPDCGRRNVIPQPPKPVLRTQPASFEGEQLELWDVDARTWEPGFANGAALYPVNCRLCQTLMYATEEQIGRELKCPDCGVLTVATRAAPKKPNGPRPGPRGAGYELDPASAPAPRPTAVPIAVRDAEMHEHARATTVGPDGRLIVQKHKREERPVRPAVPLIQGVWRMLATQEIIVRWLMTSILLGFVAWLLVNSLVPALGGTAQGIMAVFMVGLGAGLTAVWLTLAAPTFLAIVEESSEGHDRLHDPPGWSPLEWLGETMFLVNAIALAGAPAMVAWSLGWNVAPEVFGGAAFAAAVAIFPLAYMGALLENTAFGVISPKLLGTLFRRPGPWLLFYIEVALIAAGAAAACVGLALWAPAAMFAAPLIVMGAMILLMRLMGRLAWWLADALSAPDDGEDDDVDDAAAAHPHLAAALAAKKAAARAEAAAAGK